MPPNKKGGKGYKKTRGSSEQETAEFIDILEGQYMARAIRVLGNRNILCYCDDNVVRICHICRRMKGRGSHRVDVGDIVLVSLRDFSNDDPKKVKRGDILAKYAPEQVALMKREDEINPKLLLKLELGGAVSLHEVGMDLSGNTFIVDPTNDGGFDFENSGSEEEEEEGVAVATSGGGSKHNRGSRQDAATGMANEIDIDDL